MHTKNVSLKTLFIIFFAIPLTCAVFGAKYDLGKVTKTPPTVLASR